MMRNMVGDGVNHYGLSIKSPCCDTVTFWAVCPFEDFSVTVSVTQIPECH